MKINFDKIENIFFPVFFYFSVGFYSILLIYIIYSAINGHPTNVDFIPPQVITVP